MNRLLSILLIPLFVLGQALPHSHAGSGVAVPDDHAARPHVHLSGGHSHHHAGDDHVHSHSEEVPLADSVVVSPSLVAWFPDEHDSDAIYVAQSNCSSGRGYALEQWSSTSVGAFVDVPADRPVQPEIRCCTLQSDRFARLPIYLLKASLRL